METLQMNNTSALFNFLETPLETDEQKFARWDTERLVEDVNFFVVIGAKRYLFNTPYDVGDYIQDRVMFTGNNKCILLPHFADKNRSLSEIVGEAVYINLTPEEIKKRLIIKKGLLMDEEVTSTWLAKDDIIQQAAGHLTDEDLDEVGYKIFMLPEFQTRRDAALKAANKIQVKELHNE